MPGGKNAPGIHPAYEIPFVYDQHVNTICNMRVLSTSREDCTCELSWEPSPSRNRRLALQVEK